MVESIGGRPVERTTPAGDAPRLAFTTGSGGERTVEGDGGVNQFVGPCRVEGDTLELGPFRSTRMAGPVAAMRVEHALLEALTGARPFRFAADGDVLILGDADGEVRLRRQAPTVD